MEHPEWVKRLADRLHHDTQPLTINEHNRLLGYLLASLEGLYGEAEKDDPRRLTGKTYEVGRPTSVQPVALWNGETAVGVTWGIRVPYEDNRLQQEQGGF